MTTLSRRGEVLGEDRQREVKDAPSLESFGSEILQKALRALDIVTDRAFIELRGGAAVSC